MERNNSFSRIVNFSCLMIVKSEKYKVKSIRNNYSY